MLDPDQMTPDTLMANIALYRAYETSQPAALTAEDKARYVALIQERQRRLDEARSIFRPGLYVSAVWRHEPHKGIVWSLSDGGVWTLWNEFGDPAENEKRATPEKFYGLGWEKRIAQLTVQEG